MSDLQKIAGDTIAKELAAVPDIVREAVQACVLDVIGLRKDYRGYSVNHYGVLHDYLQKLVQNAVTEVAEPIVKAECARVFKLKTTRRSIRETIARVVEHKASSTIRGVASKQVEELVEVYIDQMVTDMTQKLGDLTYKSVDICDPKAWDSPLGESLLEHVINECTED